MVLSIKNMDIIHRLGRSFEGKKRIRQNLASDFIYFVLSFWLISEIVVGTTAKEILNISIDAFNSVSNWITLILLLIQILCFQTYTYKQLLRIGIVSVPIIVSAYVSSYYILLSAWMFVVAGKGLNFDKAVRLMRNILIVMIPSIFCLCWTGVLDDYTLYRYNRLRHSFGFSHPNQMALRIFQLVVCVTYLKQKKISLSNYICIFLALLFCWVFPNSLTSCICLIILFVLLLFLIVLQRKGNRGLQAFSRGLLIGAILVNIFSIWLSCIDLRGHAFLTRINAFMSYRFSLGYQDYRLYGIKLFGNKIQTGEIQSLLIGMVNHIWLDNAYMSLLLRFGVIVYVMFSLYYIYCIHFFNRQEKKNYVLLIILFLYAVYGMMEEGLISMKHNIFLLSLAYPLYSRELN